MTLRDLGNRLFWTAVAAAGGALTTASLFSLDAWEAAAFAASTAAVNLITLEARRRLGQHDA